MADVKVSTFQARRRWSIWHPPAAVAARWGVPLLVLAAGVVAHGQQDSSDVVSVRIVPAARQVPPGAEIPLAVVIDIREGWHINSAVPKLPPELDFFEAIATQIEVEVPPARGVTVQPQLIQWPPEHRAPLGFLGETGTYGVYAGRSVAFVPVSVDATAPAGEVVITVGVGYQACSDSVCLKAVPPRPHRVALTVWADAPPPLEAADPEFFGGFRTEAGTGSDARGLAATDQGSKVEFGLFGDGIAVTPHSFLGGLFFLGMAALGGFALNLMPCVLPVVPIKVMALSQAAGHRGRCLLLGVAMTAGIIVFWLALGVAMSTISKLATINGLFQFPLFTVAIGVFIAAMSVSMCGLFQAHLPGWVYALDPGRETMPAAFGYGVLTAVLATPCAAPFMGTAVAWSLGQRPVWIFTTFAAIGIGMASPYLALTAFPALLRRIPRTGPGSVLLKQVMGLLMLSAAVYFVGAGVSGWLAGDDGRTSTAYWYAVAVVLVSAAAWMVLGAVRLHLAAARRAAVVVVALLLSFVAVLGTQALTRPGPIDWRYYTPQRYAEALSAGRSVLLDFTAETCLNCKVLEHFVLEDERVVSMLTQPWVVPMKVDLTGDHEAGWEKLAKVGSVHIPRLVVVAPSGRETLNAAAYSVEQVLAALSASRGEPPDESAEVDTRETAVPAPFSQRP